jgi:hypothetical protein
VQDGHAGIRIEPNDMMLLPGPYVASLGELAQAVMDAAAEEYHVQVVIDATERMLPGERAYGAAGLEALRIVIDGLAAREAVRLADRIFDAAIAWVLRHRQAPSEPVAVRIYGPDGRPIKTMYVDVDGRLRDHPE